MLEKSAAALLDYQGKGFGIAECSHRGKEFVGWAASLPGAETAVLARDLRDPGRYVSFMAWSDLESVRAWKGSPEFKPRMSRVQEHIDKFAPTELEVVATVDPA